MRIIDLALKDLLQIVRDWKSAFFLIAMPIGFTLLFGFIFNDQPGDAVEDNRLVIAVVDQDMDFAGAELFDLIAQSETVRPSVPEDQSPDILSEAVEDGELAAVVTIPVGYSQAILRGEARPLDVMVNTDSGAGTTAQYALQYVTGRLQNIVETARFSTRAKGEIEPFSDLEAENEYFLVSLDAATGAWESPPIILKSSYSGKDDAEEPREINAFTHSSPGMMVQFAIAGLIGAAEILVLERKSGSLRRLLTTSMRRYEVLLGHYLAMLTMIFTQFVILILFAQIFLDVPYFDAPIASFLVAFVTAAFSASMGLLISTVAKNAEQVVVFSLIPMFILSGLGGAWVPLEFTGEAFQRVAYLTPLAWSMTAFQDIIERGKGLESVLFSVAVITGFTVVLFGLSAWRFRFEEA